MQGDQRISIVDLFTQNLTLISQDVHWIRAAGAVENATAVPIRTVQVGRDVLFPADVAFEAAFNVLPGGACLIRPDAIVAWRSTGLSADPAGALREVVERIVATV